MESRIYIYVFKSHVKTHYSFEQPQALPIIPDESYSATNYFDIHSEAFRAHEVLFYIPLTKDQTVQREYCR